MKNKAFRSIAFDLLALAAFTLVPLGSRPFMFLPKPVYLFFYIFYYFFEWKKRSQIFQKLIRFLFYVFTFSLSANWLFLSYAAYQLNASMLLFPLVLASAFLLGTLTGRFSTRLFFFKLIFPFCAFAAFNAIYYIFASVEHDCEKVKSEVSVTRRISFCDAKWKSFFKKQLSKEKPLGKKDFLPALSSFAAPRAIGLTQNSRYVYFSTGTSNLSRTKAELAFLIEYDRKTSRVASMLTLPSSLHALAYDEKRERIYGTSHTENKIYALKTNPLRVVRKVPCIPSPFYFVINAEKSRMYVLSHRGVGVYALPSLKEVIRTHMGAEFFHIAYSAELKKMFAASVFSPYVIFSFDERFKRMQRAKGNAYLPVSLGASSAALNEKDHIVYVSVPYEKRIYAYDLHTLRKLGAIHVPFGVRIMTYDENRNFLYAGDYIHGHVLVIPGQEDLILKKIFVGRKIRDMAYSLKSGRLFVASTNGFFELNPDKF